MLRAFEYLPAGLWDPARQVDAVLLDYDERHRRRIRLPTVSGGVLLLDLPDTVRLREGDGLRCEDGGIVRVRARPERLLELTAADGHALLRLAWHLGNRHLPVQIGPASLRIREDAVIAGMVRGLGGAVRAVDAPFDPEGGAYAASGPAHGHDGAAAVVPHPAVPPIVLPGALEHHPGDGGPHGHPTAQAHGQSHAIARHEHEHEHDPHPHPHPHDH